MFATKRKSKFEASDGVFPKNFDHLRKSCDHFFHDNLIAHVFGEIEIEKELKKLTLTHNCALSNNYKGGHLRFPSRKKLLKPQEEPRVAGNSFLQSFRASL